MVIPTKFDNTPSKINEVWYLFKIVDKNVRPINGRTSVKWCAQHATIEAVETPVDALTDAVAAAVVTALKESLTYT